MAKPTVKLNISGINQIMTSPAAQAEVDAAARRVAEAAGPGFQARSAPHPRTARAFVRAVTAKARAREARDRVLTRAVDASRR